MSFKKRLLEVEDKKEEITTTVKKAKVRNALFTTAETFLNGRYGIREWTCLDVESETAMPPNRAICVSQAPVGIRLYSEVETPHQFIIHSLVSKEKEESTIVLGANPMMAEAKTRIVSAERIADGTGRSPRIDAILRPYLTQLLTVVNDDSILDPKLDYTSFSKEGTTYVRYELVTKPSSTKLSVPVPWPGPDPHGLRLEEMSAPDAVSQRFVFSFHFKDIVNKKD